MNRTATIWSIVVLVTTTGASGCASRAAPAAPAATPATSAGEDAEAYGLREHHRYHPGGVGLFFSMSLETLGTSPEQSAAIEKARASLHASLEPLHAAQRRLLVTLADGVSNGALNPAKVDAAVRAVSSAGPQVRDALDASLNDLHAALSPAQRAALADKVEAHWAVWRIENVAEPGAPATEHGHVAALSSELDLSPEQEEQIRVALRNEPSPKFDPEQARARLHALAEAFRQEQFDARAIDQSAPEPGMAAWGAAHLARVVEAMTPVLTKDQRVQLAQKLEDHARHAGGAGGSS